jgi:hypothetical protein
MLSISVRPRSLLSGTVVLTVKVSVMVGDAQADEFTAKPPRSPRLDEERWFSWWEDDW